MAFNTSILKSLVVFAILLTLISAIYSRIAPLFAINRIFFLSQWDSVYKSQRPIRFHGLFKETNQIAGKETAYIKLFTNQLSTGSIKYLYRLKNVYPSG